MKNFEINEQDAQKIVNYLSTCPYGQVFELVTILMNLKEIEKKDGV